MAGPEPSEAHPDDRRSIVPDRRRRSGKQHRTDKGLRRSPAARLRSPGSRPQPAEAPDGKATTSANRAATRRPAEERRFQLSTRTEWAEGAIRFVGHDQSRLTVSRLALIVEHWTEAARLS